MVRLQYIFNQLKFIKDGSQYKIDEQPIRDIFYNYEDRFPQELLQFRLSQDELDQIVKYDKKLPKLEEYRNTLKTLYITYYIEFKYTDYDWTNIRVKEENYYTNAKAFPYAHHMNKRTVLHKDNPFATVDIQSNAYYHPTMNGYQALGFMVGRKMVHNEEHGTSLIPDFSVYTSNVSHAKSGIRFDDSVTYKFENKDDTFYV